jgi:oxygen-independent coproporphyrinogen-3 oxidase
VPWKSKGQRRYTEADLPNAEEKWEMYHKGKSLLEQEGFYSIGMDHFALKEDPLFTAAAEGMLHRNFMGFTTTNAKLLIGLGASSISDSWDAFAQNEKEIEAYEQKINDDVLPLVNGHLLNGEDLVVRKNILQLMCNNQTSLDQTILSPAYLKHCVEALAGMQEDGLVDVVENNITVTDKGKLFVRNICACIDAHLWRGAPAYVSFSKAI